MFLPVDQMLCCLRNRVKKFRLMIVMIVEAANFENSGIPRPSFGCCLFLANPSISSTSAYASSKSQKRWRIKQEKDRCLDNKTGKS